MSTPLEMSADTPWPPPWKGAYRRDGAIRLPSADMRLGLKPMPHRVHPLLPEYTWEADSFRDVVRRDPCSWCGKDGGTFDHIIPQASGGKDSWENAAGACHKCNQWRGSASIVEFLAERAGLHMRKRPKRQVERLRDLGSIPVLWRREGGWTCLPFDSIGTFTAASSGPC